MSSRALRKLQCKDDLKSSKTSTAEENSDGEHGGSAALIGPSKKKQNFNVFDLLNEDQSVSNDDEDLNELSDGDHETEESVPQNKAVRESGQKKKKKKRKKARRSQQNIGSSEDNVEEGEDDIEQIVQEVNELVGHLSCESDPSAEKQPTSSSNCSKLLSIEHKHLNPNNELKKIFGSRTVQAELRTRRGRNTRTLRSTWLTTQKENWPQIGKQGLSMQLIESGSKTSSFEFVHSTAYQAVEKEFLQAVGTLVPENIIAVVNSHPYHVNGNLELSDMCRLSEDLAMAAEFVERALYALEHAFHSSFNIASGTCRLPYQRQVNRPFYVALLKHALYVGGRACYRTSLEIWKLLLSLDPDEDPLAVVLAIDFYAIRSSQYEWLIQLCEELEPRRNLSQLPNMAYSLAVAKFLLAKKLANKQGSSQEKAEKLSAEADVLLREALIMFPSALPMILDKCSIAGSQHSYFTVEALKSQSPALEQLVKLYVCRSYHVWKEPDVLPWLERNTNEVIALVDRKDPTIADAAEKRSRRYRGALPRNVLRHIILCDLKEVTPNAMPANERGGTFMSLDPLPPIDSINIYHSFPRYRQPAPSGGFALRFLQSLLPTFEINDGLNVEFEDGDAENLPAAEEAFENNLFGMANNLHQSIRALFQMTGEAQRQVDGNFVNDLNVNLDQAVEDELADGFSEDISTSDDDFDVFDDINDIGDI